MSIRLFNNSGGYIDLESGGTSAAANVFTLPAETGTILTSATLSGINASALSAGTLATARLPAGSVLQVVNVINSTGYQGNSGSETALFNFSITPTSATSKIAIFASISSGVYGTVSNHAIRLRLRRGTTTAGTQLQAVRFGRYDAGTAINREMYSTTHFTVLDSPATTSEQAYCITVQDIDGAPGYDINSAGGTCSIVLMEIAA